MTAQRAIRGIALPLVSALVTAAIIAGAGWIQYTRSSWPFGAPPAVAHAKSTASPPTAGTSGSSRDRVPIERSAAGPIDIRLDDVRRESLTETTQAVATVVPDESRLSHVHTRVSGWVEQLDVNTTGEFVREGQPLARIFSQELLSSQTEYLAARRSATASGIATAVIESGRTRLGVLGMTAAEVADIETAGEPKRLVTVVAPRSGVVVNRGITVGTAVDPSTTLLTIADLSGVWVLAEVPEASIPAVRVGSTAQLDFAGSGRQPFGARVDFIYPTLTERTRTLRVRFTVGNPAGVLRPGLYGTAAFVSTGLPTLTVPREAIVDTGRQQHVFVAVGDRFEPRPVVLGVQLAHRVEVRSGLQAGDKVVAEGVFLLDSESRLRATGGAGTHNHGAAKPAEERTPAPGEAQSAPPNHSGHQE